MLHSISIYLYVHASIGLRSYISKSVHVMALCLWSVIRLHVYMSVYVYLYVYILRYEPQSLHPQICIPLCIPINNLFIFFFLI